MFGDTLGSGAKSRICYYRNIDRKTYEITVAYPLSDDLQGHSTIQSFHMQFFLEFSSMHSSLLTRFDKKHRGPSLIVDTYEPLVPWRGAGSKTGLVWRRGGSRSWWCGRGSLGASSQWSAGGRALLGLARGSGGKVPISWSINVFCMMVTA